MSKLFIKPRKSGDGPGEEETDEAVTEQLFDEMEREEESNRQRPD
jgi:hypothetical protein